MLPRRRSPPSKPMNSHSRIRTLEGRVGSGKTALVLEEIVAAAAAGERALLLVPEQTTLQTELLLAQRLNAPGFLLCEVLSPTRLISRVLDAAGGLAGHTLIDERGRALALRAALMDVDKSLSVYKACGGKSGFVEYLADLTGELSRNEQGATELRLAADALPDGLLRMKLYDLAAIMDQYADMLYGRYMDTSHASALFCQRVGQVDFVKEARVWVDGFDIMPPRTLHLITALAAAARELTVTLTLPDEGESSQGLFEAVQLSKKRLWTLAQEAGVPLVTERLLRRPYHSHEISHLEAQWDNHPPRPHGAPTQDIRLYSMASPREEAELCAMQVLSLSRQGMDFGQIAVAAANPQTYAPLLRRAFSMRGIPCFIAEEQPAAAHPAAVYWLWAMHAATTGLREDAMSRVIKSGFCGVNEDQSDQLDNLLFSHGLRGKRWEKPIGDNPALDAARETMLTPLLRFSRRCAQQKSAKELAHAAYLLLEEAQVYDRLMKRLQQQESDQEFEAAQRSAQIWQQMTDALDQAVELLADRPISAGELILALRAALQSASLATLPPHPDAVLISPITRMKGADVHALFLLGANDGVLPASDGATSLLGEEERLRINQAAQDQSLPLYLGGSLEQDQSERFAIYSALTLPTHSLTISFARVTEEGSALRPSIVVSRLQSIFPALKTRSVEQSDWYDAPIPSLWQSAGRLLATRGNDPLAASVFHHVKALPACQADAQRILEALLPGEEEEVESLPALIAEKLFPERIMGITRLERFARCPYQQFVQNGLRPSVLYEPGVRPVDAGSFYHDALEGFVQGVDRSGIPWDMLGPEQCDALLESITLPLMEQLIQADAPGRLRARGGELLRTLQKATKLLAFQLQKSKFLPRHSEIAFGRNGAYPPLTIPLSSGDPLQLEGRIDRIDDCVIDGQRYIRVIDYKSGNARLSDQSLSQGITLQLPIYAGVAAKALDAQVAGMFYFKIASASVEAPGGDPLLALAKENRLQGRLLDEVSVAKAMDEGLSDGASLVIPAKIAQKSGGFDKRSSQTLSKEELGEMIGGAEKTAGQLAERLFGGEIAPNPATIDNRCVCEWCEYKAICRHQA